jgi:hypothetical protein
LKWLATRAGDLFGGVLGEESLSVLPHKLAVLRMTSEKLHALFLSGLWLSAFVFGFLHFLILLLTLTVLFTFFHSLKLIQRTLNVLSLFIFSYTYFTVLYVLLTTKEKSASPAAPSCPK